MNTVYLIGTACTRFGKRPEMGFKELTEEVYTKVIADAGLAQTDDIEQAWFGNSGMASFGQSSVRGQVCFTPLISKGQFPERVPIINVEAGCGTGGLAFHGAWKDIVSGQCDLALAVGVEKIHVPNNPRVTQEIFAGGIDQLDPELWRDYYHRAGQIAGKPFVADGGSLFMNTYAVQAAYHMKKYGTTRYQIAAGASKNHAMGALNPLAQYQFNLSIDEVLNDREVSWPLTRAMCAPIGDGAAAVLLCSERYLHGLPGEVRERAIKVLGSALSGGKYRDFDEPGLSQSAARKAYQLADVGPDRVDVAELHDATSFGEIYQCEMLGFCGPGDGGEFVGSGASGIDGTVAVNLSGGLVSKGHPIAATGLSMIHELTLQLRGEAGARQSKSARIGVAQNAGGVIGFDEALCAVTVLATT